MFSCPNSVWRRRIRLGEKIETDTQKQKTSPESPSPRTYLFICFFVSQHLTSAFGSRLTCSANASLAFFSSLDAIAHHNHDDCNMRCVLVRYRTWRDGINVLGDSRASHASHAESASVREVYLVLSSTVKLTQPQWDFPTVEQAEAEVRRITASVPPAFCARTSSTLSPVGEASKVSQALQASESPEVSDASYVLRIMKSFVSPLSTVILHEGQGRLQERGVWAVDADFIERGAVPRSSVRECASVWNIPIATQARAVWAHAREKTRAGTIEPLAVYHGTSIAAVKNIKKTGFQPSHGMLGRAIYVGTFWKSVRYASRSADYGLRQQGEAVVFRALLHVGRCTEFDGTGTPCRCETCATSRAQASSRVDAAVDDERTRVADHNGTWQLSFDTAHVPVVQSSRSTDTKPVFVTRNEEWAVAKSEALWVQAVALLDMESVDKPHWNPLQRNQRIL